MEELENSLDYEESNQGGENVLPHSVMPRDGDRHGVQSGFPESQGDFSNASTMGAHYLEQHSLGSKSHEAGQQWRTEQTGSTGSSRKRPHPDY